MTMIDNHAPAWHTTTGDARDAEIAKLRAVNAELHRRLADAETERGDYSATIARARDALAADYAEAAKVAAETGDDPDQYRAMLFNGQRNGSHRAYALFLRATLTYTSVDAAARAIAEGTAWGQTDHPAYMQDGFTPLCEMGPF